MVFLIIRDALFSPDNLFPINFLLCAVSRQDDFLLPTPAPLNLTLQIVLGSHPLDNRVQRIWLFLESKNTPLWKVQNLNLSHTKFEKY